MDFPLTTRKDKCHARLSVQAVTNLTVVDQYYPILGVFEGTVLKNWTVAPDGTITFIGRNNSFFNFTGVSDLKVDRACKITYVLYLNGVIVPDFETPHDFTSTSKIENISTTSIPQLNKGDYINIYAKSDIASTVLTVNQLLLTFWGE